MEGKRIATDVFLVNDYRHSFILAYEFSKNQKIIFLSAVWAAMWKGGKGGVLLLLVHILPSATRIRTSPSSLNLQTCQLAGICDVC